MNVEPRSIAIGLRGSVRILGSYAPGWRGEPIDVRIVERNGELAIKVGSEEIRGLAPQAPSTVASLVASKLPDVRSEVRAAVNRFFS